MLNKLNFWLLTIAGAITLVLALLNIVLVRDNTSRQSELNQRQQFIQQSLQLEGLYKEIVKALADLATKNNDSQLKDLLAAQGFQLNAGAPTPAPSADAVKPSSDGQKKTK